jgi:hypothetical protein
LEQTDLKNLGIKPSGLSEYNVHLLPPSEKPGGKSIRRKKVEEAKRESLKKSWKRKRVEKSQRESRYRGSSKKKKVGKIPTEST